MSDSDLLRLSAQIISAHVGHNSVRADELPGLIRMVYDSMTQLGAPEPINELQMPAVSVKKSVFPSYIVCLEDGKKLKMLKRHLQTSYGVTPDQYRAKWGLPSNYPMVAPDYAEMRSGLAKKIGLGRKDHVGAPAKEPVQEAAEGVSGTKRGRRKADVA
jgi:predicted transcriptional regulator